MMYMYNYIKITFNPPLISRVHTIFPEQISMTFPLHFPRQKLSFPGPINMIFFFGIDLAQN